MPKSKRSTKKVSKTSEAKTTEDVKATEESIADENAEVAATVTEEKEIAEPIAKEGEEEMKETSNNNTVSTKEQACEKATKTSVYLQYAGNEYDESILIENIKNEWAGDDHDVSEVESIEVYIKPEELCAYYVINGTDQGSISL